MICPVTGLPVTFFATVLNRLACSNLPKTQNWIIYRLLFVTQVQYHAIKVIANSLKSPKDIPMRRPATYFLTVLKRLTSPNLSKTLNYVQYRLWFVTGGKYHPIKVIGHSLKRPEDVPIRRPTTYFVTVLIRLTSPNLPKTLNHRPCRLAFVTGVQYHAI